MTPTEIDLARRVVALLPEDMIPLSRDVWGGTPGERRVMIGRLLWQAVDDKADWLPVLDDYALLGWLITELERVAKGGCDIFEVTEAPLDMVAVLLGKSEARIGKTVCWSVSTGGPDCHDGDTRIEALVAALEAAKAAT